MLWLLQRPLEEAYANCFTMLLQRIKQSIGVQKVIRRVMMQELFITEKRNNKDNDLYM